MSQHEMRKTTIDGIEFEIHPLDPWDSHEILHAMTSTVGPAIGDLIGAYIKAQGSEDSDQEVDAGFISASVTSLFANLKPALTRQVMEKFATVTTVNGKGKLSDTFRVVFIGKPHVMYKWLAWAIGSEYKQLFGSIPGAISWLQSNARLGV